MQRIEIKTSKALPAITLPCSLFIIGTGLWLGTAVQLVTGAILMLVAILQLVTPVVVVENDEIQMRNLLGMTLRRIPFRPTEVSFDGLKVFVSGKKAIGSTWSLESRPLQELRDAIIAAQGPHDGVRGAAAMRP